MCKTESGIVVDSTSFYISVTTVCLNAIPLPTITASESDFIILAPPSGNTITLSSPDPEIYHSDGTPMTSSLESVFIYTAPFT